MKNKLVVMTGPSGAGKTSIVSFLRDDYLNLEFSISATSRLPRPNEIEGKDYYFIAPAEFRERIVRDEFVEYEEVYKDTFYGTLKSKVEAILASKKNVILDVDVKGAQSIKRIYGERALTIIIMPSSIDSLKTRLKIRNTETTEYYNKRIAKAEWELSRANEFDRIILNLDGQLGQAKLDAWNACYEFMNDIAKLKPQTSV